MSLAPFLLTLKLALCATAILTATGIPVALWLANRRSLLASGLEASVALPLVLPPSVLGFYLLLLFRAKGPLGAVWERFFGHPLVFNFEGLVLASVVFGFPFMVQPLVAGVRSIPKELIEASATLGKPWWTTLVRVVLPNMKASILTGCVLAFAHTVGEFGVVLMVGGNIEGETRVVSLAIYDAVEALDYRSAHVYASVLFVFSFLTLLVAYRVNRRFFSA
jgi:molybdate transport system permease protein